MRLRKLSRRGIGGGIVAMLATAAVSVTMVVGPAAASTKKPFRMALVAVAPIAGNPFYLTLQCYAKQEAHKLGIKLTQDNPTAQTVQAQLPVLQAAIATKPNLILLAPDDAVALTPTVLQAMKEGIKFLYFDQIPTNTKGAVSQLSYNAVAAGVADAKALAKAMGNTGDADSIGITPGIPTVDGIVQGFQQGLQGTGVTFKTALQNPTNSAVSATSVAEAAMAADPNLKGFLGVVAPGADGAETAIAQTGAKGVSVVSNFTDYEQISQINNGSLSSLVGLPAGPMGTEAIQQAYNALAGKKVTKKIVLPTATITKANIGTKAIQKYLYLTTCAGGV